MSEVHVKKGQDLAKVSLGIGLHILILFVFLCTLFNFIMIPRTRKIVNKELGNLVDQNTGNMLAEISTAADNHPKVVKIDWTGVDIWAGDLVTNSQGVDPEITKHNNGLTRLSVYMIAGIFVAWLLLYYFLKIVMRYDLGIREIILENIIIFSFVGVFEVYFFLNFASKYIPSPTSAASTSAIERLKKRLGQQIEAEYS
jgi:hypothetical protein